MFNRSDAEQNEQLRGGSLRPPTSRISRGQSAVEFAMISCIALVVLLVGVQFALIGQASLALSQGASAIARYAAINGATVGSSYGPSAPSAAMMNLLSDSILTNSGGDLTVTIQSLKGGTTGTTTSSPTPRVDRAMVTLSYATTNKLVLPNPFLSLPPLFPGITFPAVLSAQDAQLYE